MNKWPRHMKSNPKSWYFICLCLFILFLSYNRFVKVYTDVSRHEPSLRINDLRLRLIQDDNHFTDEEYDELLTSSLRRQHFDDVEKVGEQVRKEKDSDSYWAEAIIEGKDDYFIATNGEEMENQEKRKSSCEIQTKNILFLKTHHTGSDIITNIINRYADFRDLIVALPSNGLSSFYWPSTFHWRYMDMKRLQGNLPNVLCNHARYNRDVMEKFMPFNTRYVTILRNPVDYFLNLFGKLNIAERMGNGNISKPFENFVFKIQKYLKDAIKEKRFSNEMNLLKNGMFFDLGLRVSDYNKEISINSVMFDLKAKFSLVLIWEYLDESLVLMKRTFCWDTDDIIYLSSALPREPSPSIVVTSQLRQAIRKWNKADGMLYDSFNASFWEKIRREKKFDSEVLAFRKRRKQIESLCTTEFKEIPVGIAPLNINLTGTFDSPAVELRQLCEKMRMTTREYLDYFWDKALLEK